MKSTLSRLVVHGGAWDIPDKEKADHMNGIRKALVTGWQMLKEGKSALDAVESAVVSMEDDPTFDAGIGSILNADGSIEMDASIMDGNLFKAGAVAALRNFQNPIRIARKVLEETEHILLAGEGCESFARKQGFQQVPIKTLLTERELKRLEALIKDNTFVAPYAFGKKRGTVGAVAVDVMGNVAAGTSTGGTPKKIPGRVGDTPLIGCGTYAENGVGGISCTGWGEAIMKVMLAKTIADSLVSGDDAVQAAEKGIQVLSDRADGLGGVIVIDKNGELGTAFNTPRMARGYIDKNGKPVVEIE